jgi:carbon-monoxide dehydrogenase medium subunit
MKSFQYLAPIPSFRFVAPRTLTELFEALDASGQNAMMLAGGTDMTLAMKKRAVTPSTVVDLSGLRGELAGIRLTDGVLHIGSLTNFAEMEADALVDRYARALRVAAANVGTLQVRNLATLGGNLATASPAADSAPALIALGASVTLLSGKGERTLPAQSIFTGPKKNALLRGEVISEVQIPAAEGVSSTWMRSAVRNENVLSTVSVSVATSIRGGRFGASRVALGAVAPTPILAESSSRAMTGSAVSAEQVDRIASLAVEDSKPISDIRASAGYRKRLVSVLTRRSIMQLVSEANSS